MEATYVPRPNPSATRSGQLAVGDPDPALRARRRPLLFGHRLHVHRADPEDRPLQLLLHAGDHADVPVLGDLLPLRRAPGLGGGRRLVHPSYHLVEVTRGLATGPAALSV